MTGRPLLYPANPDRFPAAVHGHYLLSTTIFLGQDLIERPLQTGLTSETLSPTRLLMIESQFNRGKRANELSALTPVTHDSANGHVDLSAHSEQLVITADQSREYWAHFRRLRASFPKDHGELWSSASASLDL